MPGPAPLKLCVISFNNGPCFPLVYLSLMIIATMHEESCLKASNTT